MKIKLCKNCRRELSIDKLYYVSNSELVKLDKVDKLVARCVCGEPFEWGTWVKQKDFAKNRKCGIN